MNHKPMRWSIQNRMFELMMCLRCLLLYVANTGTWAPHSPNWTPVELWTCCNRICLTFFGFSFDTAQYGCLTQRLHVHVSWWWHSQICERWHLVDIGPTVTARPRSQTPDPVPSDVFGWNQFELNYSSLQCWLECSTLQANRQTHHQLNKASK